MMQKSSTIASDNAIYNRRWWIVGMILIGTWVGAAGNSMMPVALPEIVNHYQVRLSIGVWVIAVYSLFVAVFMPIFGWLGDQFGYRRLYTGGLIGMAIFTWGATAAPSFTWLVVLRGLQGVSAATFLPAVMGITSEVFPKQERGLALGIWAMVNGSGHGLGPIVSGFLVQAISWQAIFGLLGIISLIAASAVFCVTPTDTKHSLRRFDLLGASTLTLAILTLMFNLSQGDAIGRASWLSIGLWLVFTILIVVFVITERDAVEPFVDLKIFHNARYTTVTFIAGVQFFALMGLPILVALYLIELREMSAGLTGILIAPLAITSAIFSPVGGRLTDRFGFQKLLAIGMGMITFSAGLLLLWGDHTPNWMIVLPLFLIGIGMGFTQSPATTGITLIVPAVDRGVAMGIFHMLRFIFGTFSVTLFGLILSRAQSGEMTQYQSLRWSFYLLIAITAVATVSSIALQSNLKSSKR